MVEFRRHKIKEGEREHFAQYFDTYFPEALEQVGHQKIAFLRAVSLYYMDINDLVAEEPVNCEPVSVEFPANREKYREFRDYNLQKSGSCSV